MFVLLEPQSWSSQDMFVLLEPQSLSSSLCV
jgi:hypothetical protein